METIRLRGEALQFWFVRADGIKWAAVASGYDPERHVSEVIRRNAIACADVGDGHWQATMGTALALGATLEEAAMRCYVLTQIGPRVPD